MKQGLWLALLFMHAVFADVTIDGGGNTVTLVGGAPFVVADATTLTLKNMTLRGLLSGRIVMEGDDSRLIFDSIDIPLEGNYTLTRGGLVFQRDVFISGTNTFALSTTRTCTIATHSHLTFDVGMVFSVDSRNTNRDVLTMESRTSQLTTIGARLHVAYSGIRLKTGTLVVDHRSTFESEGGAPNGIVLGDNTGSITDLRIFLMPAAQLTGTTGSVTIV
jgi:hypothetical protein